MQYEKKQSLNQLQQGCKFFLILTIFIGCTSVKYTKSSEGQPLASYYSFSKEVYIHNQIKLDTSNIYANGQDIVRTYNKGGTEKLFVFRFFKFGSNGVAFYSNTIKEPLSARNVNSVNGQYCYYKISDNELLVELYDLHLKKFKIKYAKIYGNKIQFYKERLQTIAGGKEILNLEYQKSDIKFTRPLTWPE